MEDALSPETEVLAAEAERQRALLAADTEALDALLAEDLIHVHSSGQAQGKAEFIAHVAKMGGFLAIERGPLDVRLDGPLALVTGRTTNTVRRLDTGRAAVLDGFASQLYRRTPLGWRLVLSQLTPFKS